MQIWHPPPPGRPPVGPGRAVGERARDLWEHHRWATVAAVAPVIGAFWALSQWIGGRIL